MTLLMKRTGGRKSSEKIRGKLRNSNEKYITVRGASAATWPGRGRRAEHEGEDEQRAKEENEEGDEEEDEEGDEEGTVTSPHFISSRSALLQVFQVEPVLSFVSSSHQ